MNPGGPSSSLYRELITPSRIGNITVGAWKHTHTHARARTHTHTHTKTHTHTGLRCFMREKERERERERERTGGLVTFFSTREAKSCLVEHTKIGEVQGNSKRNDGRHE